MRKIIFRGKRIGTGEWVRGGIVPAWHETNNPMDPEVEDGYSIVADGRAYAVTQESIGQYTGADDRDGKPIFEDDLVEAFDAQGAPLRGRVRFGPYANVLDMDRKNIGFYIAWANAEFYRIELGFWRDRLRVVCPWADDPHLWDQWCEEAAADANARKNM